MIHKKDGLGFVFFLFRLTIFRKNSFCIFGNDIMTHLNDYENHI